MSLKPMSSVKCSRAMAESRRGSNRIDSHLQPQRVSQDAKASVELVGEQRRAAPGRRQDGNGIPGM
jgi:hypothetical protein